ncbi:predicted protein [Lichtheimia corymbifera JMRC:FSU:9682]|uniref:Uncharacterized protein n=1 Tax=Lichtheimia corymbifera JMRC:FSU:9682 TaxID=1263082 RepID=A0A068RY79_9FUNG|nr:predicted protein [Lichtheimia corymbifera JMRC:FSU:9682]
MDEEDWHMHIDASHNNDDEQDVMMMIESHASSSSMAHSSNMASMLTLRRPRSSSDNMMGLPTIVPSTTTTGPSLSSSPLSPTSSSSRSSAAAFIAHHHHHRPPVDPGTTRRQHHLSTGSLPLDMQRTMSATLQRYESELRFLRDQWIHICITSRSLRSSYDAVPHNDNNNDDPGDEYIFPIPGTIAIDTFYVPPRRPPPPAIQNNNNTTTSRRGRGRGRPPRTAMDEEIEYEMLLSLDENILQIRQLEVKIEQLENRIRGIMRDMLPQ